MQPGKAVATVAQDLAVQESVLRRWAKELGSEAASKATDRPQKKEQSQEIERLKRELDRIKPTARLESGETCSENRVARLMQAAQLKARSKRRRLPGDSGQRPEQSIAANILDRQFEAAEPNQ